MTCPRCWPGALPGALLPRPGAPEGWLGRHGRPATLTHSLAVTRLGAGGGRLYTASVSFRFAMPRPPRVPLPPDPTLGAGHALAPGSRLEYFEIERVISKSDLGIVYLATDLALEWPVVIKEYLPASIATRVGAEVRLRG